MCDYSLQHVKSRDAAVGDKLTTLNFGMGTVGFKGEDQTEPGEAPVAVCIRPGTELAFSKPVKLRKYASPEGWALTYWDGEQRDTGHTVAIFRQVNKDLTHVHHDTLEFPDGETVLLDWLCENQEASVLQLPAEPKNEAEAEEQRRAEYVG